MVAEANLDIQTLSGTGPGGRITKEDVQRRSKTFLNSPGRNLLHGKKMKQTPRLIRHHGR